MKKWLAILLSMLLLATTIPLGVVNVSAATTYELYWPVPTNKAAIGTYSSKFGPRTSPTAGASTNHRGIDIAVPSNTSVYAAADGEIIQVSSSNARGNYVLVYHSGLNLSTLYQHLTRATVQKGDKVKGGQQIALSGNTGIGTGAHLHFGVMVGKATKADHDQLSYNMAINPLGSNIRYTAASGSAPAPSTSTNPDDYPVPTRSLFYTSPVKTGDDVRWVQAVLVKLGYNIAIDGSFGPATRDAVKAFQKAQGLTQDGSCGEITRGKLKECWEKMKHTHTYTNACDTTCNVCGATRSITHNYANATCTKAKTCTVCGATTGSALGHKYSSQVTTAATCGSNGVKTYTCSACGNKYTESIPATGKHNYSSKVTTAATCTANGVKTYTCSGCGHSYTEVIPAGGHNAVPVPGYAATCTKDGLTEGYVCSGCGAVLVAQEVIPARHTPATYEKQPTCAENGLVGAAKCTVCGEMVETGTVIPALGHSMVVIPGYEPTCTEDGLSDGHMCSRCGEVIDEGTVIPAKGHSEATAQGYAPTCTEAGITEGSYCPDCHHVFVAQEIIDALGHDVVIDSAVEPTCTEDGLTEGSHCSRCGEILVAQITLPVVEHTIVIDPAVEPTVTSTGLTEGKHCDLCGTVLVAQQIVDKLPMPGLPDDAPAFVVDNVTAREGEEFTVAIRTQNNSGIVSFKLKVAYDADVLELVSAVGKDFANMSFSPLTNNPFILNWVDAINPDNTTDGVVALLTFRVKEGAAMGTSDITLSYDAEDVYDTDFNNVSFRVVNGTVTVVKYTPGDVNNDESINNKDLGLLQRYLNEWDVTLSEAAADTNGDDSINNKDLGLLQRYLNEWNVTLG